MISSPPTNTRCLSAVPVWRRRTTPLPRRSRDAQPSVRPQMSRARRRCRRLADPAPVPFVPNKPRSRISASQILVPRAVGADIGPDALRALVARAEVVFDPAVEDFDPVAAEGDGRGPRVGAESDAHDSVMPVSVVPSRGFGGEVVDIPSSPLPRAGGPEACSGLPRNARADRQPRAAVSRDDPPLIRTLTAQSGHGPLLRRQCSRPKWRWPGGGTGIADQRSSRVLSSGSRWLRRRRERDRPRRRWRSSVSRNR
ncbi:hypothetical protein SAMN04489729_7971 [Amycolatopsis lurida]|nr:hypothetical protein SAMN04489729_7971 [Amycolatopsis lurida]